MVYHRNGLLIMVIITNRYTVTVVHLNNKNASHKLLQTMIHLNIQYRLMFIWIVTSELIGASDFS